METIADSEGLIPRMFKRWKLNRRFTRTEQEELMKIESEAYMKRAREFARQKGLNEAEDRFTREEQINE